VVYLIISKQSILAIPVEGIHEEEEEEEVVEGKKGVREVIGRKKEELREVVEIIIEKVNKLIKDLSFIFKKYLLIAKNDIYKI